MDQMEAPASPRVIELETAQDQVQAKGSGFSWLIAVLLLTSLFLNYIDRQTLSVLVRFLPAELKMSNIVYAHITSAFLLAYALAMPLAGWFVDRLGARLGLAITVTCWSLFESLCGTSRSVFSLGAFRFLLGIPEAAGLPAITKVAAEHAAPHAKATLVGIAMFGLGMGTTFAPPIVAFLSLHASWRWAFYATGLAGFVWVLFWLIFYRTQFSTAQRASSPQTDARGGQLSYEASSIGNPGERGSALQRAAESHGPRHDRTGLSPALSEANLPWVSLLRNKTVIGLTLTHVFAASTWWFYLFWIPPYLNQVRHLNIHEIGIYGWIPYFFASIGSAFGGYVSGALVRRGWEPVRARKAIMWACACIVPFTSFVVKTYALAAVLSILAIATFFIQAYNSNLFAVAADIFAPGRVASVVGLNVMCNALAAIAVIQFTGHIVEHSSYTPAFVLVALLLPTASLCAGWLVRPDKETSNSMVR